MSRLSSQLPVRRLLTRTRLSLIALLATFCVTASCLAAAPSNLPPIRHVFIIMLENESYPVTFGPQSIAPYLARELPKQGALLPNYYGIGHYSLDNYIAMISGQAPNPDTQADCSTFSEFVATAKKPDANGQLPGTGCVYPKSVSTLANQLTDAGFTWKAYMEDMGKDPARESATCAHPVIGTPDITEHATPQDQYATKHNPFMYFHTIIDKKKYCDARVVNLDHLGNDLAKLKSTPNFVYVTPNLCHDGHDAPCKNGEPGGLISADAFLRTWVPRIIESPAFKQDGLLIITFDEGNDGAACCNEKALPGGPQPGGKIGPGGGRIGAVLLSPYIAPGTQPETEYNHYSLLRTLEDIFSLSHLGYAQDNGLRTFGNDVFTAQPASK
ncbi:alkaline phosphatase family protein [Dyella sp.]|uniref:alkaline phosphatase family protein n=1 Tax=Dyella sp. TaxID=1869338 RepID=UPI002B4A053A|nr:alkaline phosphatase family protein [Dyella sp.]HKT30804.1 alkaline phosphatase family protein [Dyella sp.]